MRTRTILGSSNPTISLREYAWDKSTTPYSESANFHPYQLSAISWLVPNGYKDHTETIIDDTGTDGAFRNCLHTVETNSFSAPLIKHRFYRGFESNLYLVNASANQVVTTSLGKRTEPSIDMEAYAEQALAFMLPRLNEGLSLVNFVLELKDLKRMDPRGSFSRIKNRHLAVRDLVDPRTRKQFTKELVTRLNGAALNATFGINPFVKDVVQTFDDLTSLASRLEALKKYANTRQERHYKRVIPESPGVPASKDWSTSIQAITWPNGVLSDNLDNGGQRRSISLKNAARWIKRPVYHATMRYFYTLPEVDSQLERIYTYLDTLGVRLDPSIIWNAIPFSFVVDWVVDVSGFLGSFARDNYPINVTLLDFCHSYSWHKQAETYIQYTCDGALQSDPIIKPGYPFQPGWRQVYTGSRTYYSRVRTTPDIHAARQKAPRLRQAALSLSLLLSKTRFGSAYKYTKGLESTFLKAPKAKGKFVK